MAWISWKDRMPKPNVKVLCRIEHCGDGEVQEHELVAVEESDCNWRLPDGCELSHEWNVVQWWEE